MPRTIHFCGVVGGTNVDLLPRLVEHYRYIGVNGRWLVGIHMAAPDDPILERVQTVLNPLGVDVVATIVGPWRHRLNPGLIARARALYPDDWCVIADQDEFQVYPDALQAVVGYCEERDYQCVQGDFVDRLGPGGALPQVDAERSLWGIFPLGGEITLGILKTCSPKTVLARGDALVGWGNHLCFRGRVCPRATIDVPIHHFKWDASVLSRLREREELYLQHGEMCAHESAAFVEHIVAHGRINIDDSKFRVRYIGNPYGTENILA